MTDLHSLQASSRNAHRDRTPRRRLTALPFATGGIAALLLSPAFAEKPAPETYEAALTGVSATGITLKMEILNWSDDAAREAVVLALGGESNEITKTLDKLPSIGAVWQSGSAVGHSIKYAERANEADGTQRITLVTTRPLDSYSFKPWTLTSGTAAPHLPYGVIELKVDNKGSGTGTLSLAAEVAVDANAHTVRLKTGNGAPTLLTGVKLLPKPYWAGHQ